MNWKEHFRKLAIEHGFAEYIVIDNPTYAEVSEVVGAFLNSDGVWIAYSVDERGSIYDEAEFSSEKEAFFELARRLGFEDEF